MVLNQSLSFQARQLVPALENRAMLLDMENTHPTFDDRLRAHGERLLKALDAQPVPETYAEILRAARALIAVKKALDLIHREAGMEVKSARPVKSTPARNSSAAEPEAPVVINRQMRRRLEAEARKRGESYNPSPASRSPILTEANEMLESATP